MPLIQPDFSEVKDTVTAGTYKVRVVNAEVGAWEKSNTQYINWSLETFGEADAKNNGRRVFHKTPTQGKGSFRLADFYKAAMRQPIVIGEPLNTEVLLGKELQVVVVDGTDREGNLTGYAEVKAVRPL